MNILLVDDSEVGQFLIGNLLRRSDHQVDIAGDGIQAWDLLESNTYDIVCSDILMPRLDGFELCYLVKSNPRTRHIPFIFFSAEYLSPKDQAFALKLGAARYIFMTEDPIQFVRDLETTLSLPRHAFPPPPELPVLDERNYLKEYKDRLFAQLHEKLEQLQETTQHWIEERQAAQRLRALDQLKDDFIAMISHELRNPLTAIMGYCGMLAGGHLGSLTQEQQASVAIIDERADHLLKMINQMLSFVRMRSQHLSVEPEAVDLQEVIARGWSSVAPQAQEKSLTLETTLPAPPPAPWADRRLLEQVLIILLDNAVKFTPAGGHISVTVSASAEGTRLQVRDTGIGIEPDDLDIIFEPFRQAGRPNKEEGVGLGLAIARQILANLDGRIELESRPQQGATFTLVLPHQPGLRTED